MFLDLTPAIVPNPLIVTPDIRAIDAIVQMGNIPASAANSSRRGRSGCAFVVEEERLVGILTEQDVVRLVAQQQPLDRLSVRQVMGVPAVTLYESTCPDWGSIVNLFQQHQIRDLPILDDQDHLVGVITAESLWQAVPPQPELYRFLETIDDVVLVLDREGTLIKPISTNPKNLYRPTEEWLGRSLRDIFSAEQTKFFLTCIQQALTTGQPQDCEYSLPIGAVEPGTVEPGTVEQWFAAKCVPINTETVLWIARNISDRKRAEAEAKQTDAQLRTLSDRLHLAVQAAKSGIWDWDIVNDQLLWDDRMYELYGVSSSETPETYEIWKARVHPEDALASDRLIQQALAGEKAYITEYRVLLPDGTLRYIESYGLIQRDSDGRPLRMIGLDLDISERKLADTALHNLMESTAAVTGKDFFSTLAQQLMLALKVQYVLITKLVDDRLESLAYWKDHQPQPEITFGLADVPACARSIEQGQFYCPDGFQQAFGDYPLIQALGVEGYLGMALVDRTGQKLGNLCIMDSKPLQDIQWAEVFLRIFATRAVAELERQQATEALELLNQELELRVEQRTADLSQSEEKFRQLAENVQSVFWITDAALREIIYASPAYETVWGRSCESLYSSPRDFIDAIHPEDRARVAAALERQTEGFEEEYRIFRPDGTMRWVRDRGFPIYNMEGEIYRVAGITEDITAQKQAEETLNRQLAAIEAAIDGIAILNTAGELTYLNQSHVSLYGYRSAEELLGKTWRVLCHPSELERFEQEVFPTLKRKQFWRGEAIAVRQDGSPFIKEISLTLIAQGEIICICRDISDRKSTEVKRKQAELALRQSEEEFRTIFDYSPIAISLLRLDNQQILKINHAHHQLFGYSKAELTAIPLADLTYADDWERDLEQITRMKRGEIAGFQMEKRFIRRNGEVILVNMTSALIRDRDGTPLYSLGMFEDITERKQSEMLLKEQQEFLRRLIDTLPNLIFVKDWDGRFTLVNQATADIYQSTIADLIGKKDADFNPNPAEVKQFLAVDREVMTTLTPKILEETVTSPSGKQHYFQTIKTPIVSLDGRSREILGISTDITHRKQVEEQLRHSNQQLASMNAELARATRLKDEFLANMSHELRTPLTAILGMTEMLRNEVYGELNSKQHQYLEVTYQSGKHLLSLINDILDLAKIESGKLDLLISSVAVENLCHASLSFVEQTACEKNIELTMQIADDIDEILVDEIRIRQAIINLLSNAVKFTPDGGQVALVVSRDRVQQTIQFNVIDTGIGIASENMPKLFQSFVQIDSSLSRQYGGTGLGLVLVKKIVELHQGSVAVESALGQGSRFTIILPDDPAFYSSQAQTTFLERSPERTYIPTICRSTDPLLVLLAEDHQANIETLSSYLISQGYRLLIAINGQQAVSLATQHQPDIILMDVQMPKLDGLTAIQQIRQIPNLVNTPIIALTALAMSGDRERCLAAGANEYLTKPVKLKSLVEMMKRFCEQ